MWAGDTRYLRQHQCSVQLITGSQLSDEVHGSPAQGGLAGDGRSRCASPAAAGTTSCTHMGTRKGDLMASRRKILLASLLLFRWQLCQGLARQQALRQPLLATLLGDAWLVTVVTFTGAAVLLAVIPPPRLWWARLLTA